jgi:hypothetical protein
MPNAHRRSRPAARLRRRALCQWIHGLGIDTFVGSSGRVFPTDMKAAPLLRAWLKRLRDRASLSTPAIAGWAGTNGGLRIHSPEGEKTVQADAVLLALGGGSWARLGSDGAWMRPLEQRRLRTAAAEQLWLRGAAWSELMVSKFAGALKNIAIGLADDMPRLGECVITDRHRRQPDLCPVGADPRSDQPHGRPPCISTCPAGLWTRSGRLGQAARLALDGQAPAQPVGLDGVKAALLRELTPATFTTRRCWRRRSRRCR